MKIVPVITFITELSPGGAQTTLWRLLAHLNRERFKPIVVCLYNGDGAPAQQIRDLGIQVFDLGMTAKWRLDACWRLYRLLRREHPVILHTWLFHANILGRILGRLAGVPIIISSERTMGMESQWRYRLNEWTAPLVDRISCVSQNVATFARESIRLPQKKLVVIPNGVVVDDFLSARDSGLRARLGFPDETVIIGSVARLHPVKGSRYLVEAFAQLALSDPALHLLLIGDGPERAGLETWVAERDLEQRITFLGERTDISALLSVIDVFVLSSLWEGMPNAVLEAMAAGLPVIATAVGGTPEVVLPGVTGLLGRPGDVPALTQALAQILQDPTLQRTMGQAGLSRVQEHFSITSVVRETTDLYEMLLLEKGIE